MVSVESLRSLPFFVGISMESLKALAAIAEERNFKAGEAFWKEGDTVQWLLILRRGEVDVIYQLQSGKQCIVDTVVGGELTGWSALVEPYRHTATCVARENGSALYLEAAGLRKLCVQDPAIGYHLLIQVAHTLSSRLNGARVQLAVSG